MPVEGMALDAIVPELILLGGSVIALVTGLFLPRRRQWIIALIASAAMSAGLAASVAALNGPDRLVFHGAYTVDTAGNFARIVILYASLLVVGLSFRDVRGHARETEFYVLLLFSTLGLILLAGAADVMLLVVAYLLSSVPLYTLVAFRKDAAGTEAAMKYFLMGALLGVTMLYGLAFLYGAGGATAYVELARGLSAGLSGAVAVGLALALAGLIFKLGAVPGHFWVPDVAEGAPAPIAAYVTTVPKVAALVAMARLLVVVAPVEMVDWRLAVALLAAATMTLGNLGALWQDSARRLLGYSTISQVGYMLMAVAVIDQVGVAESALLYYLLAYATMNLCAFAVVVALPNRRMLSDYSGLFRQRPGLALALALSLFSLIGIPPLAGFVGKLSVFTAAWDGGYAWLTVLAAANTAVSMFYYLRWLIPVYFAEADRTAEAVGMATAIAYLTAAATVVVGLLGPLV
jgi:NADH-quinone oxidoreductase subunit N